jgi:hypothetical protein
MDHKQPLSSSAKPKTAELDAPLDTIGFEFEDISAHKVSGNLHLTQKCCQVNPYIFSMVSEFSIIKFHSFLYFNLSYTYEQEKVVILLVI